MDGFRTKDLEGWVRFVRLPKGQSLFQPCPADYHGDQQVVPGSLLTHNPLYLFSFVPSPPFMISTKDILGVLGMPLYCNIIWRGEEL